MKRIFLTVLSILMVGLIAIGLTGCSESPVSFKLNFVVDGEIIKTIDTTGNEVISVPTNPEKEGYTFDGWFWDNNMWQRPFTANSLLNEPLTSDMSVYAKFTKNHTHNYSEQVFEPTCTEQGYTKHTCYCGDQYIDNYVNAKGHSYSTEWTTDDTYHWHVATCEHTNEIKDKATHAASEWLVDENASYESKGSKHKECTVCKKVLETAEIPQLIKDEIRFNTLSVDGTNVYGKIPNSQDEFDFLEEIEKSGNATYKVSKNKAGSDIIESKTAEPIVGDNTYYILVYVNGELDKKYTVTIRRRPIYTVTFNTNGGTLVDSQSIEEDSFATEPTTTKTGYSFISWDYDFDLPITENKTITASWQVNSYPLTINYYYKDSTDKITNTYTSQVDFDDSYNIVSPLITGYTADNVYISGTMDNVNGKTFNVYYSANKYTLTINYYYKDTTNKVFDSYTSQVAYDSEYSVDSPLKTGYSIDVAKVSGTMDSINGKTFNVYYTANANIPYKIEYYFENIDNNNYTIDNTLTKNLFGTTDTTANAEIKTIEHFTPTAESVSGNIEANGSLVLKVYYTRNNYTLSNANTSYGSIYSGTYKYGKELTSTASEYLGCEFLGWFNGENLLSSEETYIFTIEGNVIAKFKIKDEMSNFNFTSTFTSCEITGIKDKTIKNIVVPDYVTSIEKQAFCDCSLLESAIIGNGVTSIGSWVFQSCSSLTSVTIGNSVSWIGSGIFQGCSSLESIEIPNSVNSIGDSAFYGCSSIKYNEYDNGLYLGNTENPYLVLVKAKNTSITNCIINNKCIFIYYEAFFGCSSLISVTMGNSVGSIYSAAFYCCSLLENITIPNSVTSIGSEVFSQCNSLQSVAIGDGVLSIGGHAFYGCSSLETVYWNAKNCTEAVFTGCNKLKNVVMGDKVKIISSYAFSGCSSLTSVSIGKNLESIGEHAFDNCSSLETVYWNAINCISAGSKDNPILSCCEKLTEIIIEDNVKNIPDYAFYHCRALQSITIPNSVTSIGEAAFSGCSSLNSVIFKENSKLTSIDDDAFSGCSLLTSIVIPNCVTSIGEAAFSGCSGLTCITIPFIGGSYSATSESSSTVFGYIFGKSSYIGGNKTKQYYSNFSSMTYYIPTSLKSVTIMGGNILHGAFDNCSLLENITIPNSVTSIGEAAFSGCSSLKYNEYDNALYLGNSENLYLVLVKAKNELIKSCTINDNCIIICSDAFSNCKSLESVTISNSVTSIGCYAFYGCWSLTSIKFSDIYTWYITETPSYWRKKINGTEISVTDEEQNVNYFMIEGNNYWYKL